MPLPPNFLDELRARTPLAPLIGRKVKLARNGRQWKGCCPFHNEKTPSFYVYDDHYHCFGCGQHGDAIGFTMATEGLPFRETVERLASEAGLEVPKESPREAAREARARDLHDVLAAAAEHMGRQLRAPEGREGLDYLRRRGLTDATIERFALGWSSAGRGALAAALKPLGIEPRQLAEAGLVKPVEGREGAYNDFFYNRVMFPIRDRRGRIVSFGGRILGDGQPKYLNGPETDVFSKRRTLYGLDLAREAVFRDGADLIVAEGYMDVIALHQAGFGGAVAPLGTALTAEQMAEIWKVTPAPVLCLDADAAGLRAAARSAEMALPLLATDRTLTFATVEGGKDPDELIRERGRGAFEAVLAARKPIWAALYDLRAGEFDLAAPEGRAAFRNALTASASLIPDKALASEIRGALLDRFFREARPQRPPRPAFTPGGGGPRAPGRFDRDRRAPVRIPPRAPPQAAAAREMQARCLLAITLAHPWLLDEVEEAFALLELPHGPASELQAALLAWHAGRVLTDPSESRGDLLDSTGPLSHLDATGHEGARVWATRATGLPREATAEAQPGEALAGWWHFFGFLRGEGALVEDLDEARRDLEAAGDAAAQGRVVRLIQALSALRRGETGLEDGAGGVSP